MTSKKNPPDKDAKPDIIAMSGGQARPTSGPDAEPKAAAETPARTTLIVCNKCGAVHDPMTTGVGDRCGLNDCNGVVEESGELTREPLSESPADEPKVGEPTYYRPPLKQQPVAEEKHEDDPRDQNGKIPRGTRIPGWLLDKMNGAEIRAVASDRGYSVGAASAANARAAFVEAQDREFGVEKK